MNSPAGSRTVLMLARHFPPVGGAGVHRSLGYVQHLPEHNFEPVVITNSAVASDRWSPQDESLLAEVPSTARIHRITSTEPPPHHGWRGRLNRWFARSQPWASAWVDNAVEAGLSLGAGADLVLASCVPYETAEAGARLSAALGVPWVADLEDPWALDEMRVHATAWHRRVDRRRMVEVLSSASAIIMSAPEAARRVRAAMPGYPAERILGIPIGFESRCFRAGAGVPRSPGGAFRIVHTGSLHTELGMAHRRSRAARRLLGGSSVDVDILTRSHVFLIDAIDGLLASQPELRGRVELHLGGELTEADRAVAGDRPYVRVHGQLTHPETIGLMRSADLLFLPMHDLPAGSRAGLIPYKTFEYLAAERPILAAVPDGDVRDMLLPVPHASVVRPADVSGMAEAIRDWIGCSSASAVAQGAESPLVRTWERRRLVASAAAAFDDVLEPRWPTPLAPALELASR